MRSAAEFVATAAFLHNSLHFSESGSWKHLGLELSGDHQKQETPVWCDSDDLPGYWCEIISLVSLCSGFYL